MKYVLCIAALIVMFSCSVPPKDRMEINLMNKGDETVEIRAGAGFFSRTIVLKPGQEWKGWVPRKWAGDSIWVRVKVKKKKPSN